MLWRSQFTGERWSSFADALSLERMWHAEEREVRIATGPWVPPFPDGFWMHRFPPGDERRQWGGWRHDNLEALRKESYFTCDMPEDMIWHGLAPLVEELDMKDPAPDAEPVEATTAFALRSDGQAVSVTQAMLQLWLASSARRLALTTWT